jgi:hypothetical protein
MGLSSATYVMFSIEVTSLIGGQAHGTRWDTPSGSFTYAFATVKHLRMPVRGTPSLGKGGTGFTNKSTAGLERLSSGLT